MVHYLVLTIPVKVCVKVGDDISEVVGSMAVLPGEPDQVMMDTSVSVSNVQPASGDGLVLSARLLNHRQ